MTKVTSEIEAALAAIPYLAPLAGGERAALARRCLVKTARKGATIFTEGDPATGLWLVLGGRVRLVRSSPRGREQTLHSEPAGATLGEGPVFDGGGYVATALAEEDARLLFVPRAGLLDLCRRRPEVALGVITVLARRVRAFAALIEDLALRDVTARLARFILAEPHRGGEVVELPGTREEIAARLGTVRELVSRSLSQLRSAGAIEVRGRRLRLTNRRYLLTVSAGGADMTDAAP